MNDKLTLQLNAPGRGALAPRLPAQADSDAHLIRLWLKSKRSLLTREEYLRDVKTFFAFVSGHNARLTEEMRKADIEVFLQLIQSKSLGLIRVDDLENYKEHLVANGSAASTLNRRIASVKSLFSYGARIGYLIFDIGKVVQTQRADNIVAERLMSEEAVLRLIEREETPRNRALLKLFYASGGRVSEIARLTWKDLIANDQGSGLAILTGKGGKKRDVKLPPKLWTDLQTMRGGAADSAPLFPSRKGAGHLSRQQLFRLVKAAARRIDLPAVSPHWLRHSFATHGLKRGASLSLVSKALGHSSIEVTGKYLHAAQDEGVSDFLLID